MKGAPVRCVERGGGHGRVRGRICMASVVGGSARARAPWVGALAQWSENARPGSCRARFDEAVGPWPSTCDRRRRPKRGSSALRSSESARLSPVPGGTTGISARWWLWRGKWGTWTVPKSIEPNDAGTAARWTSIPGPASGPERRGYETSSNRRSRYRLSASFPVSSSARRYASAASSRRSRRRKRSARAACKRW